MPDVSISVITPCFNSEFFIGGCIDNVVDQNCPRIEHLIMDGGSTDSTVKVISGRAKDHPHIRWVSEPDRGQSHAMNKGIAMAQGSIIGHLNVDDCYKPGVLNRVVEIFSTVKEPAFVVANCDLMLRSGRIFRESRPKGLSFDTLMTGEVLPPLNPTSYFYHKSLHDSCGLFVEEEHNFMDIDMLARITRTASIHYFDESWGIFRLHPNSKTNQRYMKGDIFAAIEEVLNRYLDALPEARRKALLARKAKLRSHLAGAGH